MYLYLSSFLRLFSPQGRPRQRLTGERQLLPSPSIGRGAGGEGHLAAAQAIGDRLMALALQQAEGATWFGLKLSHERYWSIEPLGLGLYDGLPGVVLFLAYLGSVTQQLPYTNLAQAALATIRRRVRREAPETLPLGVFTGWGGIIYALTHLAVLWQEEELLWEAESLVELCTRPQLLLHDQSFDLMTGAAGAIAGLLTLYHVRPTARTLQAAIQCGEWLIAHAQPMRQGIGWSSSQINGPPLAGISHGAAGIASLLLKLAAVSQDTRFHTTALDAITYERSLFSLEAGNWPDLRTPLVAQAASLPAGSPSENNPQTAPFMSAWCHGATGIGLARLSTLFLHDDGLTRNEINVAIQTTLREELGSNHSLCHGALGNLDFLGQASRQLPEPALADEVRQRSAQILVSIQHQGWRCGIPFAVDTPSLMTGLAGIGYGLLRLAAPEQVPSVLTLEPPREELKFTPRHHAWWLLAT